MGSRATALVPRWRREIRFQGIVEPGVLATNIGKPEPLAAERLDPHRLRFF
jgi:hypothetical protein